MTVNEAYELEHKEICETILKCYEFVFNCFLSFFQSKF